MTMVSKQDAVGPYPFVDALNGAVRENPVSAGLIGLGVLWMFFGNAKFASLAQASSGALAQVNEGMRSAGEGAVAAAARMSDGVGEAVRHSGESAKTGAAEAGAAINIAKSAATRTGVEFGQDMRQSIQKNLNWTLDKQPLLLGLIGLGIGAGIASMFSSTEAERELVGAAAAKVKDRFEDVASEVRARAEKVVHDVRQEAAEQGLTPEIAREQLKNVVSKVNATAAAARESVLTH